MEKFSFYSPILISFFLIAAASGCANTSGGGDAPTLARAVPAGQSLTGQTQADELAATAAGPTAELTEGGSIASGPINVPDTPFEKMLSAQIASPGTTLNLGDDSDLVALGPDLKSQINVDNIRVLVFNQINADRKAAGQPPVVYDRLAEKAANLHVLEQLEAQHWLSHYSLDGDLPYMRFSRVGGVDYDDENAATISILAQGVSTSDPVTEKCSGISIWPEPNAKQIEPIVEHLALSRECSMMAEVAPDDGHKKAILNAEATSVGISVGLGIWNMTSDKGTFPRLNFFLIEEFATRGLKGATPLPLSVSLKASPQVTFAGQMAPKYKFDSTRFYFEKLQPKTADQAGNDLEYSHPATYEMLMPPPPSGMKWELTKGASTIKQSVQVKDDVFSFPMTFDRGPGVYSFIVVAKENGTGKAVAVANKSVYVLP